MDFFIAGVETLKSVTVLIGGGLAVWGLVNLLDGYGNDNAGANAHG